ncbi:glycosyltransferase [Chitinophaga sp.]|uniref:glycosyltransferase n=1 Tax=Chitinophaga sp. TaxID=1869181 RepID=UPI0031DD1700
MKFSVLIPVYIKETPTFFKSALDSILHQTVMPEEIVIVADGPLTAELDSMLREYAIRQPEIFTIVRLPENKGMGYAMDTGVKMCRNEWIARMDSDDIALTSRFEKQVAYLQKHPEVDILGAAIEEFMETPGDLSRQRNVPEKHDQIRQYMKLRSPMNHMTVLFRKKSVLAAGSYWHKRSLEDYHLWYQMMMHGATFHNLPEVLVYARVGNDMVGRRKGLDYIKQELDFFRIMRRTKFISAWEFYKFSMVRTGVRMLPKKILEIVYKRVLRK